MPLLILGAGYVGSALQARFPDAMATHRPGKPLAAGEFAYLLDAPATWKALSGSGADVVWTFPAKPLVSVQAFHQAKLVDARSLIVFGSTSAYLTPSPGETVTESSPLDLSQERVAGEEWLRQQGATVLQLAGIFGPGRHPLQWLRKGLIKNGRKRVNLIHVDDIVAAIETLLAHPRPGERINLSNGQAPEWNVLAETFRQRGDLPADFSLPEDGDATGKLVRNDKLRALLPGREFKGP